MTTPKTPKGWTAVKRHLKDWDSTQLTALLKDLYDSSADTRAFLDARIQADSPDGAAIETYRQRIVDQFYPKRGEGRLKQAEARKAVRDYKKATGNLSGTIDLLLTHLESGTDFTLEFGDIDGPFYDGLCSVMDELARLLEKEGPSAYAKVTDRLKTLGDKANGIGWGYGDHINERLDELEEMMGD